MDCRDINRILNDHAHHQAGSVEADGISAHLNACSQCADAWLAGNALAQERFGSFPPEARSALLASVQAAPGMRAQPRQLLRAASIVAMAAASALIILLVWPSAVPPEEGASAEVQRPPLSGLFADASESRQANPRFVDGVHFRTLAEPVPTAASDRIEVCEFFMFPCVHCFEFEQPLRNWYQQRKDVANLRYVPVIWNGATRLQAQAYYTAQVLGIDDVMAMFFEEIHVNGGNLNTVDAIRDLLERRGIAGSRFELAFSSEAVRRLLAEAADLNRRYAITVTPSLAVNGRFVTDVGMAGGSYEDLFAVVDHLVAAESDAVASSGGVR